MISFRFHLVSLVAVLLALATGIALGSGPLQGSVAQQLAAAERNVGHRAATAASDRDTAAVSAFQDDFAAATGSQLVGQRLDGHTVALLSLPGAEAETVDALRQQVLDAGGTVTGTVQVREPLLDPDGRQLADGLSQQVLDGAKDVPPLSGLSSYGLAGTALGRALLTSRPTGDPVDDTARTISTSFTEAEFVADTESVRRRAGLALLVAGPADPKAPGGQDQLVTELVQSMHEVSAGVVVAGPASASRAGGLVAAVRDGDAAAAVSTVDTVDVAAGRIVTVLALAEQAAGRSGHYGTDDAADGALPATTE